MTTPSATIVSRHLIYDGWYRFYRLELGMPDGARAERHLIDNGSAVAVLPYDAERRVVMLVTQPRAPLIAAGAPPLYEAIAGSLERASPEHRAREEAMEEGGLLLETLEPVTDVWTIPSLSTERVMLYLAPYTAAARVGPGGGLAHEHEYITVHEIGLDALRAMAMAGELTDAKTLVLAQALLLRHPELWA